MSGGFCSVSFYLERWAALRVHDTRFSKVFPRSAPLIHFNNKRGQRCMAVLSPKNHAKIRTKKLILSRFRRVAERTLRYPGYHSGIDESGLTLWKLKESLS